MEPPPWAPTGVKVPWALLSVNIGCFDYTQSYGYMLCPNLGGFGSVAGTHTVSSGGGSQV